MSAKISKIIIEIGNTEQTLTLEQAKELRDALESLLGSRRQPIIIKREVYPQWPWRGPYWHASYSINASSTQGHEDPEWYRLQLQVHAES